MRPLAPTLFSTITGLPRDFCSCSATSRATASDEAPAWKGTTILRACLVAKQVADEKVIEASPATTALRRRLRMKPSLNRIGAKIVRRRLDQRCHDPAKSL